MGVQVAATTWSGQIWISGLILPHFDVRTISVAGGVIKYFLTKNIFPIIPCLVKASSLVHWCVVADVSGMDGLLILHQAQGSHDSTDSGSLPPTYSRLPPDGHEFPEGEPA